MNQLFLFDDATAAPTEATKRKHSHLTPRSEKPARPRPVEIAPASLFFVPRPSGTPYQTPEGEDDVPDAALLRLVAPPEVQALAKWLVAACRAGLLPDQPFPIKRGLTQTRPAQMIARLRRTFAAGAVDEDTLALVRRLFAAYRTDAPDLSLGVQVLHKGTPKLVCLVFKVGPRLIALHEATPTQNYGPLACPGGIDRAALLYLSGLGVQEWHHWTKTEGPLWVTTLPTALESGIREKRDDRDRHFLPVTFWERRDGRTYKPPWIDAGRHVVLDPDTGEAVDVEPSRGKTPANTRPAARKTAPRRTKKAIE